MYNYNNMYYYGFGSGLMYYMKFYIQIYHLFFLTLSSAPLVLTTAWPLALICAGCDPLHWWPGHCEPAIGEIEWSAQSEEYTGWTPGQGNVNIQFVPLVSSPAPVTGDWSCSVCVKIPHFTAVNPICLVIPPSQTPAYCQARSELNI